MALNKKQTSTGAKVILIGFVVVLAVMVGAPSISSIFFAGNDDTTEGTGVLDSIAAEYQPTADRYMTLLQSDPTSATLLVGAGNHYFDWGEAIRTSGVSPSLSFPYWALSSSYYEQAVQAGAPGPEVKTDMAVAYFYGGDVDKAIFWIETALDETPGFPTALYNSGIFYQAANRNADALTAFRDFLAQVEADPTIQAGNPDEARSRITQLEQILGSQPGTGAADPSP